MTQGKEKGVKNLNCLSVGLLQKGIGQVDGKPQPRSLLEVLTLVLVQEYRVVLIATFMKEDDKQ